ncbi:MAG: HTH domain-containing protein [Patescibacteria group bacterium]
MENISILDQIINNQKAEEVAKLNAVEIVNNLFNELSKRERDVLVRRFGLHGQGRETLETVGKIHSLTRERIRQIENSSVNRLRQLEKLEEYIDVLKKVINQLLEEHGGIMERNYLLKLLVYFSADKEGDPERNEEIHKSHLDFLISKLLSNHFEEVNNSKRFLPSYKLKYQALDHLEVLAQELLQEVEEKRKIILTGELFKLITNLDSYKKNQEKFNLTYNLDISRALNFDFFEENADLINNNKILYSLLRAARNIEQNKFGFWGIDNWREIKPKTINDKIYLVLKNNGKPMHFAEIANYINKIGFDNKKANAATVHNELILDIKYVLVGRGLYGLKEWGYQRGTVIDVIREILASNSQPLSRDEIIEKVLEKRMVKKTTVILALMNKDVFDKVEGKYRIKAI